MLLFMSLVLLRLASTFVLTASCFCMPGTDDPALQEYYDDADA